RRHRRGLGGTFQACSQLGLKHELASARVIDRRIDGEAAELLFMPRPLHLVVRKLQRLVRARARFFARAYDTPIDCLVILLQPRNLWRGVLSERRVALAREPDATRRMPTKGRRGRRANGRDSEPLTCAAGTPQAQSVQ